MHILVKSINISFVSASIINGYNAKKSQEDDWDLVSS